jgi:uncharacterized protein involved in exopolysaccharide biosynthesis
MSARLSALAAHAARVARTPRLRRRAYACAALVLAIAAAVPQPYVGRAQIVPQDGSSIGLSSLVNSLGSQYQSFAALLGGGKQPIDLYLAAARSDEVTGAVIDRLHLADRYGGPRAARLALGRRVDVHSLTGGILEVTARDHDPDRALALTRAYVTAITARLNTLSADRVTRKRAVVTRRFADAGARVSAAEAALDVFRRGHNLAAPEAQLGAELSLRAQLQAQLQARQVELGMLEHFQSGENPQIQATQAQISGLRAQIASSATPATGATGPNVAGLSDVTNRYLDLYRDYRFAQALYEVYARASEEVEVEALTTESASDAQVIEAPRLDADRKVNLPALALLALVAVIAAFTEIYAPATGLRLAALKAEEAS